MTGMDWTTLLNMGIGGIVTSLIAVATIPAAIKKAKAEARQTAAEAKASELQNMKQVADGWRELAEERQEANKEKDERIAELTANVDARYVDIGDWRDKYNALQEENTALKVYKATNEVKLCMKRGCQDREPQTGY